MNVMTRYLVAALLILWLTMPGHSEETQSDSGRVGEALKVTTEAARLYEFEVDREPPQKLTFHPKSILRWSNPIAGEISGNVFVWTYDGRTEVIASIFQWYSPITHGSHSFHSLVVAALIGSRFPAADSIRLIRQQSVLTNANAVPPGIAPLSS